MDYGKYSEQLTRLVRWTANAEKTAARLTAQGAHSGARYYKDLARLYFRQYQALQKATGL